MVSDLKTCIDNLREALKEDKSEGSYYYSWQANIAMSFFDVLPFKDIDLETQKLSACVLNQNQTHELCNKAAKNFLNLLIS